MGSRGAASHRKTRAPTQAPRPTPTVVVPATRSVNVWSPTTWETPAASMSGPTSLTLPDDRCGPGRIRTCDLGIKSPLLYQLSYRPFVRVTPEAFEGGGSWGEPWVPTCCK